MPPDLTVAVVDYGVSHAHPDLRVLPGWDPNGGDGSPIEGDDPNFAHGTACAGIIAARAGNGEGIAGVAPGVAILPIRIVAVDEFGWPYTDLTLFSLGLREAVQRGGRVVSTSWGLGVWSQTVRDAIKHGTDRGAAFLFAAGNSNRDMDFPAVLTADADLAVIAVGGSSPCDERKGPASCDGRAPGYLGSCFDNGSGVKPDVLAPSMWIYTTDLPGDPGYNGAAFDEGIPSDYTACPPGVAACGPDPTEDQFQQCDYPPCESGTAWQ